MHHLEAPRVAYDLPPQVGPLDDGPRVPHAHPDRVAPRRDRLLRPIVGHDVRQFAGRLHDAAVLFDRDEVRVGPLAVE
eukprot:6988568-Prymnesium_polylepis.1